MVITFLIILHVIICLALVFIVLIQTGKGGLDSNFGGVATSMLGTQGANEFVKFWTKILFGAFVISCVFLAFTVKRSGEPTNVPTKSSLQVEAQREIQQNAPTQDQMIELNESVAPSRRQMAPGTEADTSE